MQIIENEVGLHVSRKYLLMFQKKVPFFDFFFAGHGKEQLQGSDWRWDWGCTFRPVSSKSSH